MKHVVWNLRKWKDNTIKQLGIAISDYIVFEDAKAGVEAAKTGGFVCVGID